MNTGAIGAISTHVNSLSTGVNAPVVAGNLSEGQVVDGLVGAVGLAEGMASIANRGNPARVGRKSATYSAE